ncbi:ABC transporter permease [Pusillimonas minor]|uniref:MlaE family lipid ABC transporter permease subunit n=1 Tax=Pusillimonas minor TaxID=2697024 RepID=A0A842HNH5_9BURK|nr:MlaE family lipid ABC transporter permease subunit [Pusillimonas minor]MBC2769454.1 MlaE family lipid ABC transporter permease subunit [Pusillimonas minor]
MTQHTPQPPQLRFEPHGQTACLVVAGDWTLEHYNDLYEAVAQHKPHCIKSQASRGEPLVIDMSGITALDTSGAQLLVDLAGNHPDVFNALSPERQALLRAVVQASLDIPDAPEPKPASTPHEVLARVGASVEKTVHQARDLLGFMGVTFEALARTCLRPKTWRVTAVVAQLEQTGFNAVPIIALLTFMVGAVVAFLGATILADFGASVFTINLVAFSFLREFAVLLTAILMAGRTASAFTAQLGSMKGNEEIDALRMTGLDPVNLLVLPRIIALLIALPLLTFIGMVSGILGGMLVCAVALDISPSMFMSIFQRDIQLRHFALGMAKAPIFAYLIAIIGCLEGFKVKGSAQSLGEHTTSAVVQSIFVVILVDAIAAMFFLEMGW